MLAKEIKIEGRVVDVDIKIRGSRIAIRGDSSTGKSLLVDIIQRQISKARAIRKKSDRLYENIEIFYYARTEINEIRKYNNKLIIVDNADELLKGNDAIVDFINNDCNNQYIFIGRSLGNLHIMPNYICHIVIKDSNGKKTISLEYDYTGRSWW